MHDGIYLSYIGLTELEVKVLKSIFTLAPQLQDNCTLIPPSSIHQADLILVNADDPESIRQWTEIRQANSLISALLLTDSDKLAGSDNTIQRPIRVQKLIAALEEIIEKTDFDTEPEDQTDSGLNVMVVDDSYPVRKYMEHKLSELAAFPVNLSFASNGQEAIEKASQTDFHLIFLDVMMEGMDGYKACKAIKAENGSYIVMLTSKKSPFDKVRGTMSGCDAYITKPPADERLEEELSKCMQRRKDSFINLANAGSN
jgi:twitching motility two-component system response regulator PilG